MKTNNHSRALALGIMAATLVLAAAEPAFAQADPFTQGVNWFSTGPARGVAMLAVAGVAVAAWMFSASLRIVGLVLAGGLALGNLATIVGWMGF
jgi:hypothetical protein